MNQALIHGQLSLSYPDGFREMGREEMKALYQDDNPDRWGLWDQDRHIIVAVLWHDSSPVLAALAGAKDVAKTTEKRLKRGMKAHGYRFGGFFQTELCGLEAHGFRYSYQVGEVTQAAETLVLKRKNTCFTIYYYAREELDLVSRPVYEEMLRSLRLKDAGTTT